MLDAPFRRPYRLNAGDAGHILGRFPIVRQHDLATTCWRPWTASPGAFPARAHTTLWNHHTDNPAATTANTAAAAANNAVISVSLVSITSLAFSV